METVLWLGSDATVLKKLLFYYLDSWIASFQSNQWPNYPCYLLNAFHFINFMGFNYFLPLAKLNILLNY
jgi:hypothetical protein